MSIETIKTELKEMIETVEKRKKWIDAFLATLKETVDSLNQIDQFSPGIIRLLLEPVKRQSPLFTQPIPTSRQPNANGQHGEMPLAAASRAAGRKSTQFQRICNFFIERQNQVASVRKIILAVGASRASITNILYRTQKEAFVKHAGHRLILWSLKPELYKQLLARAERTTKIIENT